MGVKQRVKLVKDCKIRQKEHLFIHIRIQCGFCGELQSTSDVRWSSAESECDMCGSHGYISVILKCKACGRTIDKELYSW